MRAALPVLLDFTGGGQVGAAAGGWADHVSILVVAPLAGSAPADGVLIRPDGYVAWAAGPGAAEPARGLADALRTWCGAPG